MNTDNLSLEILFEEKKDTLVNSLRLMSPPYSPSKIGFVIKDFVEMLVNEGKGNLPLTSAEEVLINRLPIIITETISDMEINPVEDVEKALVANHQRSINHNIIIILATFLGGVIGGLLLGLWWVCLGCSLIGLCISLVLTRERNVAKKEEKAEIIKKDEVNTDSIIEQVRQMCKEVDTIMNEYRCELKSLEQKYKAKLSVPFEDENLWLLTEIQSLIGYERYKQDSPKYLEELKERCEDLVSILSNKELEFVDYDATDSKMFDIIDVDDIEKPVLTYPAILKEKSIVLKGQVFVPHKK